MSTTKIKQLRLFITLLVAGFLIGGTLIAIKFAKGYRPNIQEGKLNGTGLLSATSYPRGAKVIIDGKLTTLTDDTLYLKPATYKIEIKKEGFTTWNKEIPINEELVSNANARLFPTLPAIAPITYSGVSQPTPSHDGSKIAYVVNNGESNQENGLYIMSLSNNFLSSFPTTQIAENTYFDYSKAHLFWAPNGNQILALFTDNKEVITAAHLLETKNLNQTSNIIDVTIRLNSILNQWQEELNKIEQAAISKLPQEFQQYIKDNQIINFYFSSNQEKVLYQTIEDFILSDKLITETIPSINSTPQQRKLKKGAIYVYDSREDTNYLINQDTEIASISKSVSKIEDQTQQQSSTLAATTNIQYMIALNPQESLINQFTTLSAVNNSNITLNHLAWYPTGAHLIKTHPDSVQIIEYDNQNPTTLFQTNISSQFATPSPNGTYLITLTNLNQKDALDNLFSLDLK